MWDPDEPPTDIKNPNRTIHAQSVIRGIPKCRSRAGLVTRDFTAVTCPACLALIRKSLKKR